MSSSEPEIVVVIWKQYKINPGFHTKTKTSRIPPPINERTKPTSPRSLPTPQLSKTNAKFQQNHRALDKDLATQKTINSNSVG